MERRVETLEERQRETEGIQSEHVAKIESLEALHRELKEKVERLDRLMAESQGAKKMLTAISAFLTFLVSVAGLLIGYMAAKVSHGAQ